MTCQRRSSKLKIALDKAAYQPGERIVATATLINVGDAPINVRRSADETGRSDGLGLTVEGLGERA